jgi:hypothetical protein
MVSPVTARCVHFDPVGRRERDMQGDTFTVGISGEMNLAWQAVDQVYGACGRIGHIECLCADLHQSFITKVTLQAARSKMRNAGTGSLPDADKVHTSNKGVGCNYSEISLNNSERKYVVCGYFN